MSTINLPGIIFIGNVKESKRVLEKGKLKYGSFYRNYPWDLLQLFDFGLKLAHLSQFPSSQLLK